MRFLLRRLFGSRIGSPGHLEALLRRTAADDPQRDARINDLAAALNREFQSVGNRAHLERSVSLLSSALARNTYGPDLLRAALLTNHGVALRLRAGCDGAPDDLAAAVENLAAAERLIQPGHPQRPLVCSELGTALAEAFEHSGDLSDLDRAVSLHEEAVGAAGETDPRLFTFLNNLGAAHSLRFRRTGDPENRERAVAVLDAALTLGAASGDPIGNAAANLGELLRARYESWRQPGDIERSIALTKVAIGDSRDLDPHQPGRFINLGLAYESRARSSKNDRADLRAALDAYSKAARLLAHRPSHPWRAEADAKAEQVRAILAGSRNLGDR